MPPFRGNQLAGYADTMAAVAQAEIARWPRGRPVRLHARMQALTLEVILRAVFGLAEGPRLDQLRAELVRALSFSSAVAGQFVLALGPPRARAALARKLFGNVNDLLYAEIDERRRADRLDERGDVLSILLQARHEDDRPMSDVEIRDELITLLVAGHETTATALAWAVERLARHPDHQARLTEETHAGEHQFCDAVVKETLRLRPVLSLVARRLKAPMEIGGIQLPAGVTAVPSIYLMHRRPDIYPDPKQFRPSDFLNSEPGPTPGFPSAAASGVAWARRSPNTRCASCSAHCSAAARCGPPASDPNGRDAAASRTCPATEPLWCWDRAPLSDTLERLLASEPATRYFPAPQQTRAANPAANTTESNMAS